MATFTIKCLSPPRTGLEIRAAALKRGELRADIVTFARADTLADQWYDASVIRLHTAVNSGSVLVCLDDLGYS